MINTSDSKARARAEREAEAKSKRRATQAQIVAGLQTMLESDEQLLGFARGLIAGGLRGKLTVGFEALFAPYVNIGLTERRVVLQHIHQESGKPSEILPHSFPLSELASIVFSDIETFGSEPAGRLVLRLYNDQHFRLRVKSAENVESAQNIADVFSSLTSTRPKARTSPTQSVCPHCDHILDRVSKFCPYCGQRLETEQQQTAAEPAEDSEQASAAPEAEAAQPVKTSLEWEWRSADPPMEFEAPVEADGPNEAETPVEEVPINESAEDAQIAAEQDEERTEEWLEARDGEIAAEDEPTASFTADDSAAPETVTQPPTADISTEGHEAVPTTDTAPVADSPDAKRKSKGSPRGDH